MSEAARRDLYNGLSEVIGPDRAEILMAQLPRFDPAEVGTRSDLAELRSVTKSDLRELRAEMRHCLCAVNQRLDRLLLALLIGMFGMVVAMVGVIPRVA